MKTKPDIEAENEQLDYVTFEQAEKLMKIGLDWNCRSAYDKDGNDVNWTTKQFHCWKPTVALALKFIRKRFAIQHHISDRHWETENVGFCVWFSLTKLDCTCVDLSEPTDKDEDGIVSFDYDETESIALDYLLRYLLPNYERDFSWVKVGKTAYLGEPQFSNEAKILKVDNKARIAEIRTEDDTYNTFFHRLYKTEKEAMEDCEKQLAED